jgi:hypothetical protein
MSIANSNTYRQNRSRFPTAELQKHEGKWVAFSSDGLSILANGQGISEVCEHLRATGHDPQQVVLERIELDSVDVYLGGGELH